MLTKTSVTTVVGANGRENRTIAIKGEFNAVIVQASQTDTVITLLYSSEAAVIKDAIIALNRYGIKAVDNLIELYNKGIVKALLNLIYTRNELDLIRFSLKLLSLLVKLPQVVDDLNSDPQLSVKIFGYLTATQPADEISHEYAASILAVLTENRYIVNELLKHELLPICWQHIECFADTDILNSTLQILYNLLQLPNIIDQLIVIPTFQLSPIVILFDNQYIEIQMNALKLMLTIVSKADDSDIYNMLTTVAFVFYDKLLNILSNSRYVNTYEVIVKIFKEVFYWEPSVTYFLEKEYLPRLLSFIEKSNVEYLRKLNIEVITNIAKVDSGRHELYMLCIDKYLLESLENHETALKTCEAINQMVKHPKAVKTFADVKSVELIITLLSAKSSEDDKGWIPERNYIIEILVYLIWCDPKVPDQIITNPNLFQHLLDVLSKNSKIIPVEYFCKFLYLFQAFALCKQWYNCVMKTNLLDLLHEELVNNTNVLIKTTILNVLSVFMCDQVSVDWSLKSGCYLEVLNFLNSTNIKLIYATISFINQLSKYKKMAYLFVKNKLISTLEQRAKDFEYFPLWKQTLNYLYDIHLPSKFNSLGRLEVTDITENRFYVLKSNVKDLPILEDLIEYNMTPIHMIYVSTFEYKKPPIQQLKKIFKDYDEVTNMIQTFIDNYILNESVRQYSKCKFPSVTKSIHTISDPSVMHLTKRSRYEKTYKLYRPLDPTIETRYRDAGNERDMARLREQSEIPSDMAFREIAPRLMSWVGFVPGDPYLREYLTRIKNIFQSDTSFNSEMTFVKLVQRIEFLAKFVVACTSGPIKGNTYLTKSAQLNHLNQIKLKYGTNIIPLGFIRIGSHLERAMLYKVLADQLQIPCSLVRGDCGYTWNEVPLIKGSLVSKLDEEQCEETDGPIVYFVVDLMDFPGRLYPVCSKSAINYCTPVYNQI